jgi:hypothetical protein
MGPRSDNRGCGWVSDSVKEQIQELTKQYEGKVDTLAEAKKAQVMKD